MLVAFHTTKNAFRTKKRHLFGHLQISCDICKRLNKDKNQSCHEEMDKKDIGIPISYYHYRLPYSSKLEDAGGGG